jgi:phage gp16-like protein
MDARPDPWDVSVLVRMDDAFLKARAEKADNPEPDTQIDAQDGAAVLAMFQRHGAKKAREAK